MSDLPRVSPYLENPLRTLEQARADRAARRQAEADRARPASCRGAHDKPE